MPPLGYNEHKPMNTLRESAGQVLWIGFEGNAWDSAIEALLRTIRPGGVIFFQRNITSAEQFRNLVGRSAECLSEHSAPAPFLAVDLEGGRVDRLRGLLRPLPSLREASRAGMALELGRTAGREAAAFSLNVDFAPVLDVASPESETVLGSRTASDSPAEVAHFGDQFLAGLSESGTLGCGKHFPGLGRGRLDSHLSMPRIGGDATRFWNHDLLPFRVLALRLPMVMVAHAAYPGLESEGLAGKKAAPALPASISQRIISDLLKRKIGYPGLVLSDDLEMRGVLEGRSVGDAAVQAIDAGCDMLLVCRRADSVHEAFEALVCRAERDREFRLVLDQAAQKIIRCRRELPLSVSDFPPDCSALREEIQELASEIERRLSAVSGKGIDL